MVGTSQTTPLFTELAALRHRLATLTAAEAASQATIEAQQYTIEELQIVEEELRQQHDELLATRQAVEVERARYMALFDLAPTSYLVTTTAGVIQDANRAATVLLATPQEALIGKPLVVYVAPEDHRAFRTQLLSLPRAPHVQDWELGLQPWHGPRFPASLTVVPVAPAPGQPPVLYWLVRDLTERHQIAAERRQAEHFTLLGRLAASVAHEIRNPLGAIFLHTDNLAEELQQLPPVLHASMPESLTEIQTECLRLQALVEDYLSLARLRSFQGTPVDLSAAVAAMAQEMQPRCAAQGITLHLEGLAALGTVVLHEPGFRRAVLNLMQNALDAMPTGGILTVRGTQTGTQRLLEVCDTGSGIAAEHLPQLFTPLFTTKPQGTGLGLYVVREIIVAHGGTLTVQSALGHGTTFTITLPGLPPLPAVEGTA